MKIQSTHAKYDNVDSCNSCGQRSNYLIVKDTINGNICEAETICQLCGHEDYWAYGWFESGQGIKSNSYGGYND